MYHAYRDGYSLLPRLNKIREQDLFLPEPEHVHYLEKKKRAAESQSVFVSTPAFTQELERVVCDTVGRLHPTPGLDVSKFQTLAMQIHQDLIVHKLGDPDDFMAAGSICFPSGWWPEQKIGEPLADIHRPIPGMRLNNSRKLVEMMVYHGPFERYVWSVIFNFDINGHPSRGKVRFDPNRPVVNVKLERQSMFGFPDHDAALFVLHVRIIPEKDLDRAALANALSKMTQEQLYYKNLEGCVNDVLNHLLRAPL